MTDHEQDRITGEEATYAAMAAQKYPPVKLEEAGAAEDPAKDPTTKSANAQLPVGADNATLTVNQRKPPPRVRKPSPLHDRFVAPTDDLKGYHARLRETLGNTMSDEFVSVMLGKLVEALRPGPHDRLDEATFNAALAMLHSFRCQSEHQVLIAVEIIATGFAGMRFLRQSQTFMIETNINVYGGFAQKLIRLQLDLMQTLERLQRGSRPTVGIERIDIHAGAQVVGIVNQPGKGQGE
jgi:hypothetical protein